MEDSFDRLAKTFPSNAHRIAWYLGSSLLPFREVIPEDISGEKAKLLSIGEKSLHEFFAKLYSEMYRDPKAFRMAEVPDLYFENGEWYKNRPDMTKARGKNSHVLKALEALFTIGRLAKLSGNTLAISVSEYEQVIAEIIPKSISRPKMKGFIAGLTKLGLIITGNDTLTIRSTQYPNMLIALKKMCRHGGADDHELRLFAFYRCDFKALNAEYNPDISQILRIIPEDEGETARAIIETMIGAGYQMKLQMGGYPNAMWTLHFSGNDRFKVSSFFFLGFSLDFLNRFCVNLHCVNPQYLIPLVQNKGDEYSEWFVRNWRACDGCGYCRGKFKNPGPYLVSYGGKKKGLCHQNWMEARNPSRPQVDNLLKMVALHTEAGMAR